MEKNQIQNSQLLHFILMKVYLALLLGLQVGVQKWLVKLLIQFLNLFLLAETHFIVSNIGMNIELQTDGGITHQFIVMDHLILIVGFYHLCKLVNLFTNIQVLIETRFQFMEVLLFQTLLKLMQKKQQNIKREALKHINSILLENMILIQKLTKKYARLQAIILNS